MIPKQTLRKLYVKERKSMKDIANILGCSVHKVQYWLVAHELPRRSIGDAVYQWHNPDGDPFVFSPPRSPGEHRLFGIGIGLYWGEGTKANRHSVRLGNADPELLRVFLQFLTRFFGIRKEDCRFGLQLFSDIQPEEALDFWTGRLKIHRRQFYKTIVTPTGSLGTYRQKSRYGVLTLYYNNKKLRDRLVRLLPGSRQRTKENVSETTFTVCRPSSVVEQHNGNV